ncbi:ATP-dependent DNA helicase RecG [Psychromonas sp. psych-6C06]|uniref:ATP-dependent DNA helicase RecG n=1 Tax=Psychromonas sp. psych-6C06 TaxID=2058089 RepID=UPI000C34594B|nr:ATP-dependent DNA helicase RecG [Psychromonas sp. psych-6C06]PKF60877.1 ATP-dependent DNA helicase RecG [Psychromonas sp. psych-6C06]
MKLEKVPLSALNGVGIKMAERLERLGLFSVADLLFHLPLHYQDRASIIPIGELQDGMQVSVQGRIISSNVQMGKRRILKCQIADETGRVTLNFFHFNASQKNSFREGQLIKCFGEFKRGYQGFEITHPEYTLIQTRESAQTQETLTPIYPMTEGLKQNGLRKLASQAVEMLKQNSIDELLPTQLLSHPISLQDALLYLHQPPPDANIEQLENKTHPAQQRLIIEELIAQQLSLLAMRASAQTQPAMTINAQSDLQKALLNNLGFSPTNAQSRVAQEIEQDLLQPYPMMRLVQGDVGSGKTLVAAMAALSVIEAGYQVALMAPTELLAEQHFINFQKWFEPLDIRVGMLSGKMKVKEKRSQTENIQLGLSKMVVGTHALFSDNVIFNKLALIIVDEQHRFGVHQRLALREKGVDEAFAPHQLTMTATPIPRTLAMTAYADLKVSIIDELPPGRTAIQTVALADTRRDDIIKRVYESCKNEGRQVYWVCTLIEESEALECQAAEDTANSLQLSLPDLHIGLVHGRMKGDEKQYVMDAFKAGELDLLVATTVIEVGVDVPNASLMIIENPERLGLSQLHQLRGRVGRGSVASHCVLLYKNPLSLTAKKRLQILRESNDGFYISEQDLLIRGPGEVLGTKQTGVAQFKIADLLRDQALVPYSLQLAEQIIAQHPTLISALTTRWLGEKQHYAHA